MSTNNEDYYQPVPAATPRHWFYKTETNSDKASFLNALFQSFANADDLISRALESEILSEKGRKKLTDQRQFLAKYLASFKEDEVEGRFNKEIAVTMLENCKNVAEKLQDFLENGENSKLYKVFK